MKAGCKLHTPAVAHDLPWGSDSCRVSALGGGGADETLSQNCSVRDDTNVHCHLVRNRDPWNQSDDDETSILLLEENKVRRVPFPSTVSGTFGLLKGKVMRDIHIQNQIRTTNVYSAFMRTICHGQKAEVRFFRR